MRLDFHVAIVLLAFSSTGALAQSSEDRRGQPGNNTGNQSATSGGIISGANTNVNSGNTNTNSGNTTNIYQQNTYGNNSPAIQGGRDVIIHGLPKSDRRN